MKVLGINGSARKDGNTAIIMNKVFEELNREGMDNMKNLGQNMAYLLKRLEEGQGKK